MAADFVPQVMSRGFHTAPVLGIFGAAVAAAKIGGFDEEQMNSAIAQCANLAAGNLEGARSGGRRCARAGPRATRCWPWPWQAAARPGARPCWKATPASITPTPATTRRADYSFTGETGANLTCITEDLGRDWIFLETLYRHLLDRRLQHRPCRRDRAALRGTRYRATATSTASRQW